MEFVSHDEVLDLLDDYGVEEIATGSDIVHLKMAEGDGVVHVHLACPGVKCLPHNGATIIPVEKAKLAQVVEHIIHLLHLNQLLLIPVGKWRKVFDAVAFSLANNEPWQAIDAAATVELNTRDPLLCEPADFHTLTALIQALVQDAESPDQGFMFIATASPVLVEVIPEGAIRISLGSQVLADEIAEALAR